MKQDTRSAESLNPKPEIRGFLHPKRETLIPKPSLTLETLGSQPHEQRSRGEDDRHEGGIGRIDDESAEARV